MKYLDDYRNKEQIQMLVRAIGKSVTRHWNIMEVCGGQTHTIARYRIEEMLPSGIKLLHGPGCPVCVTSSEIIDHALEITKRKDVIFTSFGDMMRVPGSQTDLLRVKAQGADVRMLYSTLDAVELAAANPDKEIVFFAVGFETTAPVHVLALKEAERRGLKNFSLLTSLFTVPPAIDAILGQSDNKVDAFLAAGHVCAITGNDEYHELVNKYRRPIVVAGFEPADLLYGIYCCILQLEQGVARMENAYKRAVPENGNPKAKGLIREVLEPFDQEWRGIGRIPASGLSLRSKYDLYNAAIRFPQSENAKKFNNEVKVSFVCIAGEIMKGNKQVNDCACFGTECAPEHPLGAPMVSSEGVCAAYYNYR